MNKIPIYTHFYSIPTVHNSLEVDSFDFNESDLINIKKMMDLKIISNYIWKLYLDLSYDFIFIKNKLIYVDRFFKNNIERIIHHTEYDIQ